jgi:protein-glutamine gamma-glutamyltransferase
MADVLDRRLRWACLAAAGASALPLLLQVPAWLAVVLLASAAVGAWSPRKWPTALRVVSALMIGGLVLAAYDVRIGRDTASAGLLAMLMLKPSETFSLRDTRSLLGFCLFAPFSAFLQDQGPTTLALCIPAMLLMVAAWALLAQGERPVGWTTLFKQSGFALLVAVPLALAGFWLFPRLASPLWGLPELSQKRLGLGDRMTPNEWLDVLVDDMPALRVRFLGAAPSRAQMYWRGPVLTEFDGQAWTRYPWQQAGDPPAVAAGATGVVRYEVTLEPTEGRDAVMLDLPLAAPIGMHLNRDYTAVAEAPINSLLRYTGESTFAPRLVGRLGDVERRRLLVLPPNRDPRLRARAQEWQAQTPDPIALSGRFMDWVRRDFEYTLSAPPVGFNASDDFMFDTRQGFCQHFSSAYVVFMRAAGVPARVVTGYAGGYYNAVGDYWLVYRKDAHAWAEIWIDGRGWVRVDPTAAVAPENILDTVDDLQAQQAGAAGLMRPVLDFGDSLRRGWNDLVLGFDAVRQRDLLGPLGIRNADPWQLVLAFGIGAAIALAFTLWLLLREHKDRSDPLVRAWRAFTRRLGRAGIRKAPEEAPLSYGERVAALMPGRADTVRRLSRRYSDWRYAGTELAPSERAILIRDLRRFRVGRPTSS